MLIHHFSTATEFFILSHNHDSNKGVFTYEACSEIWNYRDGSCLMDFIKSLLVKHEITGGFYLGLVLTIGYDCNCGVGSKFFILAATHGSVIHACKLFQKFPYRDVVIWSSVFKNCACFCSITLLSYFFTYSLHFACLAFTFQNHQACSNVELMSTITFSHAKGSLQIVIDLQDTQTRHQVIHLSTKGNNVGNVIVALMEDLAPKIKVPSDGK
ncbi:hypothetical protein KIW84_011327 [Lathyrus oleraceus]|uniref:Uncharacterized protein n=1 Tax=Pisum sativum TaxID=3888 RepID=A0A9D4YM80_PEA|nr:hypothetical protein KIW84_011327 [Pisum sativum]